MFPRVVAGEHAAGGPQEQVSTGLPALDKLLGGGLDRGASTLIWGPAGAGKSLVATHCMLAAAARGERSAALLFDESADSFCERATGLGLPVHAALESGAVSLTQFDPAELSPGELVHRIRQSVERDGVRLLVIDSLNGYLSAMPEEAFLIPHLHELLTYLNHKRVVTILIAAQHGLIGKLDSPFDVSYLADNVLLLRYFEAAGRVRNAISVVKRRRGAHERTLRELTVQRGGVHIGEALDDFQGVLSGVPTFMGSLDVLAAKKGGA